MFSADRPTLGEGPTEVRVHASVQIEKWDGGQHEPDHCTYLTFGKRDGKWQLFLEAGSCDDELTESDLLSAGIETRREAAHAIGKLILSLEQAKWEQVDGLKEAENDLTT